MKRDWNKYRAGYGKKNTFYLRVNLARKAIAMLYEDGYVYLYNKSVLEIVFLFLDRKNVKCVIEKVDCAPTKFRVGLFQS